LGVTLGSSEPSQSVQSTRETCTFPPNCTFLAPMARRIPKRSIPAFELYGEARRFSPDLLHIETVQSRSRLHHWEIAAHTHRGLHQILWVASGPAAISLDDQS